METLSMSEAWDALERQGVSEQTLQIVTNINGYTMETLTDILYAHTGLRAFDQIED